MTDTTPAELSCDTCSRPLVDGDEAYLHEREEVERRITVRGELAQILDVRRTYLLCPDCEKKTRTKP